MKSETLARVVDRAQHLPFVVLVSWLERLVDARTRVGDVGPFYDEPVRFRHDPSLSFHSGDITGARVGTSERDQLQVQITTAFAGLTGSSSPLPPLLLEGMARGDDDDLLQREFLDLFHHRLLGLLYRGLLKFDAPRAWFQPGPQRALEWVVLLGGLMPEAAERVTRLPMTQLLPLAPLLVTYPANAERLAVALRSVLGDLIGAAEIHVEQMTGGYVVLEPSARARLGIDMRLGRSSALGSRVPAPGSEVAVRIGPLTPLCCAQLSPGGARHAELCGVALLFAPETVQVAIELTPSHAQAMRLGAAQARLGRSSWLGSRGSPEPVRFLAEASR